MTLFRNRRRARWQKKAAKLTKDIEFYTATLDHMDQIGHPGTAERVRESRVHAWQKRNNLYAKLTKE